MEMTTSHIQKMKVSALKKEYSHKSKNNDSYSLRAFARDLGVSHTLLNLIFNGKRNITEAFSKKVLECKRISHETSEILSLGLKKELSESQKIEKLTLSQVSMMSDWIHYAVLSLLVTDGFEWEASYVANRLGITQIKAREVMQRLLELEVVYCDDKGRYSQRSAKIVIDNEQAFEAGKSYNRGLLKKASDSMDACDFSERDLSSTIFTLDPKYIPFAVQEIRKFRRELSAQLETMGSLENVYALAVQLFPLTNMEKRS